MVLVSIATVKLFILRDTAPRVLTDFVWAFCMVIGTLIYLHPRMYLTLIPVIALVVICARRAPATAFADTAAGHVELARQRL